MIASGDWLSPTRATGLVAYGAAVICCGLAWTRTKDRRGASRLAVVLMAIDGLLLLDIAFNWRWMLHGLVGGYAQSHHEYEMRRSPQLIALVILAGVLLFGLFAALRIFRNRTGALLAVSGVLLSLITWCVEVVSLHAVDHILYHTIGNVMVVGFVWILACLMTAFGVLIDGPQVRSLNGRR
jgi:hypothetical protein